MIKQLSAATLCLATILGSNAAHADYVVYTDRTAFEAAITGEKTETFNELSPSFQVYTPTGLTQSTGLTQPLAITGSNGFLVSTSGAAFSGYYPSNGTFLLGPIFELPERRHHGDHSWPELFGHRCQRCRFVEQFGRLVHGDYRPRVCLLRKNPGQRDFAELPPGLPGRRGDHAGRLCDQRDLLGAHRQCPECRA